MAVRRITPLLVAGYAALVAAMVCFGMGLVLEGTWAAGAAVVGLMLVWFAHRVVDAPARAAKAAEKAAAKAAAAAARGPSPFNFSTLAANGEVVQEREEDHHALDDDEEQARPAKVVASRPAEVQAQLVAQAEPAAAPDAQALPAEHAEEQSPARILSLEEVKADMALLRQAMLASRPATTPSASPAVPEAAGHQPSSATGTRPPAAVADLFARTEVAGLEVSFDEHAPGSDEAAAFPKTELSGIDERRAREDDFPKTQFERPN
ncbi:hypothetical protein QTH91_00515 [Variovorax dokdonensis]|uniref:Uncharacterized protein n=1 Tax=Variovorax dokdonensis TaxID=344883 RepID=A0ABT7N4S8_9BURK|nr:hypothetical protein [Variovorax dokdonensis]MDM0042951.1 hypothetical protein [Variovorax dokdonensis]